MSSKSSRAPETTFNSTAARAQLVDWMASISHLRALRARDGNPLRLPETADELILRCGRLMPERAKLRRIQVYPQSKECYLNAFKLFTRARRPIHYCEGNVVIEVCPIPVMHGWCVNDQDQVLDPSVEFERGAVYYGIQYEDQFVRDRWKMLVRKRAIGILPNTYLFREPAGWLEAGIKPMSDNMKSTGSTK